MFNPYLCEKCFKEKYHYTDEMINRAVAQKRLPVWTFNQIGEKPFCGCCGKQVEKVYG